MGILKNFNSKQNTYCKHIKGCLHAVFSFMHGFLLGPTKCEVERFTATNFGHPYIPSCRRNGDYQAVQCQRKGPCWCVDAQGKEVHGTRRRGEPPSCGGFPLKPFLLRSCHYFNCFSRPTTPEPVNSTVPQALQVHHDRRPVYCH